MKLFIHPPIKSISILFSFYLLLFTLTPHVHARFSLSDAFKLNQTETVTSVFDTPSTLISKILPNVFIISGLILFFIALGAGFTMITSSGNPEAQEKGKAGLTGAIIGFVIIFMSYWIIQILQVITGVQILDSTWTP